MNNWTEGEVDILARHFPDNGTDWEGWKELLPNRSETAIRVKATHCGIYRMGKGPTTNTDDDFWTRKEDVQLLSAIKQIARLTDHSAASVSRRILHLIRKTNGKMRLES